MPNLTLDDNGYYIADTLYQWDKDQILNIYGVNVRRPIIHFTNKSMGSAIIRHPQVDNTGVITVKIPNSLLQKNEPVIAYICGYVGETFKTYYRFDLKLIGRVKPADYTLDVDDEEVYSFNALEQKIIDALNEYDGKYDEVIRNLDSRLSTAESNVKTYTDVVKKYETDFTAMKQYVESYRTELEKASEETRKLTESVNAKCGDWNLDQFVHPISTPTLEYTSYVQDKTTKTWSANIPMINSGKIKLKFEYRLTWDMSSSLNLDINVPVEDNYIKIYRNGEVVYTIERSSEKISSYTPGEVDIDVQRFDVIRIEVKMRYAGIGTSSSTVNIRNLAICANLLTPYTYFDMTAFVNGTIIEEEE